MPRLARFMMLGIMAMFIALRSACSFAKWATLVELRRSSRQVAAASSLLAFGSAATFMFWAKWLGKLAGIAAQRAERRAYGA